MIGKLKGIVDALGDGHVLIDVHGVGYLVFCSLNTLGSLGRPGEAVTLHIETFVREDQLRLFGFESVAEREWFRLLLGVQGVGARVALAVLSTLSPAGLADAIALQDRAIVARTPGIGPKVAQRIVTELKNKAPGPVVAGGGVGTPDLAQGMSGGPAADAVSALANLGYRRDDAARAVAAALAGSGEDMDAAALIRLGLKELAP